MTTTALVTLDSQGNIVSTLETPVVQDTTKVTPITYLATTNGVGYSQGDLLCQIEKFSVTTTPPTWLSTTWKNLTTDLVLSAAPTFGTFRPVTESATAEGLTIINQTMPADLQAVVAAYLPLPDGASTSANQVTANTALSSIATSVAALASPLTVTSKAGLYTFQDRSGTIVAGGTSQALAPVNLARKKLLIQNPSSAAAQGIASAESLFINFTSAAGLLNGSIELLPGGSFTTEPSSLTSEAVYVWAATTGHYFTCKEA